MKILPFFIGVNEMFEALMIICFGLSWPASIYKSYCAKSVKGKSKYFLWLIFSGYIFGIFHKCFFSLDWVVVFYILNAVLVFIDIVLYYRYRKTDESMCSEV